MVSAFEDHDESWSLAAQQQQQQQSDAVAFAPRMATGLTFGASSMNAFQPLDKAPTTVS